MGNYPLQVFFVYPSHRQDGNFNLLSTTRGLKVEDHYNLLAPLQMFTAPKKMNNTPAILFTIASPPLESFFLKTYVTHVSTENHKREPKKTPATSMKRETLSAVVCTILVLEKTAPNPNMDIGFVRARRNVGTNVLRGTLDRSVVSCTIGLE
jgi:hypothetical protein